MLAVYVMLIQKGMISLEQVPSESREKVAEALGEGDME
ncbi:hypothetical protein QF049_003477 [Paenibacillus sp. W4I10]|nr:CD1375 family protein [Paenibacillus sp. W4I10]MDQ0722216.1 hypothetical protein [Paenibacillus sp. W4I10]